MQGAKIWKKLEIIFPFEKLTVNFASSGNFLAAKKMSFRARTMIPGFDDVPTIVYVFPEPVAPYANTVAL